MKSLLILLFVTCAVAVHPAFGQGYQVTEFPHDFGKVFTNRDGSCVFCSIGMCGLWQNCPKATYALWDTDEYGRKWRGGAYPSRVEAFADARGIPMYNITGDSTIDWIKWASRTGRMSAVGCYSSHFQTCLYWNPDPADPKPFKIKNNWAVSGSDNITRWNEFTEAQFIKFHNQSGKWVVVLKCPPPPVQPVYVEWWR